MSSLDRPSLKAPEPRWLQAGAALSPDAALRLWRQAACEDAAATVHFLPPVALNVHHNPVAPIVYARWVDSPDEQPALGSLAVLVQRKLELSVAGRLGLTLNSRRVLENMLLGDRSAEALADFGQVLGQLLGAGEADCISFSDLDEHDPMRGILEGLQRQFPVRCFPGRLSPHWWIRFPEKPEDYWSQFSKKTRYNFRYRAKHLEHSVRCIQRAEELPEYLNHVMTLFGKTWQSRRLGFVVRPELKMELWRSMAAAGAFRSYLLMNGDEPLAFATGYQWKGRFIYEETGYDPDLAAKSPGQVLLYRLIEDLIARDCPQLFDFGFGDGEYKRIYANHQTVSGPYILARRSLRPMAALTLDLYRTRLGHGARTALGKLGVASVLRHIHRGHRKQTDERADGGKG